MDLETGNNLSKTPLVDRKNETAIMYLKELSKRATNMSELHTIDYQFNQAISNYSIIPLVIVTTFTGAATFFETSVPPTFQKGYLILIGCSNILAGLISIIREFIRIREMKESRINYVAFPYNKLSRDIQLHINCAHEDPDVTVQFVEKCMAEYHRIAESTPAASNYAIRKLRRLNEMK